MNLCPSSADENTFLSIFLTSFPTVPVSRWSSGMFTNSKIFISLLPVIKGLLITLPKSLALALSPLLSRYELYYSQRRPIVKGKEGLSQGEELEQKGQQLSKGEELQPNLDKIEHCEAKILIKPSTA